MQSDVLQFKDSICTSKVKSPRMTLIWVTALETLSAHILKDMIANWTQLSVSD